ncbi:MAG: hypothetical protein MUE79_00100 [Nitratireductor sp.]|jgi:uncharacterized ion transporter superfamily protein YfcC|nr:hypothetical protein [Nitratireductor sp.]
MSQDQDDRKQRGFPSPLTILVSVLVLIWIATFFIPAGEYNLDAAGNPIAGSYHQIEAPHDFAGRLRELLLAPVNGLYGIQDPETGQVGPFNRGAMFGAVQVFLFVLAIGGFMTVVFATGSLDLGIHHLAYRFRARGPFLIVILSVLFGLLGSVMSWSDETLGMYALIIPLMVALRYDRIVAVAVVTVAPYVGRLGSTINPFVMGIGSDAAGITLGDGIGWRILLFVLVMATTILYTLRYASLVQADPRRSISGISAEDAALAAADAEAPRKMSGRDKAIIAIVVFTFALLTFSIIPWGAIIGNYKVDPYTHETINSPYAWELGWWLPELSALFFVMAIVVGVVGGLGEKGTASAFIKGVVDFTGPAFLVTVARGISVVLTNTKTIDTALNAMEGLVSGTSTLLFTLLTFAVSLPLSFLIGSGSAGTALVLPILAPLGDFAGVDRSLILTTWSSAGGWLSLVKPTNAILIAGLALAKVGFDQYLRFMLPLMGLLLAVILAVLMLASAVG